ncbi:MAG: HD domain-containing phosphohydrolase [Planctomycetaceae bacterium]
MSTNAKLQQPVVNLDESIRDLGLELLPESKVANPVMDGFVRDAKVMIVDDEAYNILVVRKFLQHIGYQNFITTTQATEALELLTRELPDVVLLDVSMPDINGLQILQEMKADPVLSTIPVVILTATLEADVKTDALKLGATDFLSKPVEPTELVLRVRNVLAAKAHFDQLANYSVQLEHEVQVRTRELVQSRQEVIYSLARASEFRDNETGNHVVRVGRFAGLIARQFGFSDAQVEALELAAQLHDVGKIGIPDKILHKADKLDHDEYEFMKRHCGFGKQIINSVSDSDRAVWDRHPELGSQLLDVRSSPIMRLASRIALTHHERWDGSGYPLGLAGEDIPVEGRITAVADVFDALSSKRPYKDVISREKCFAILEEGRGSHFDPAVLDAFFKCSQDMVKIQMKYADVS